MKKDFVFVDIKDDVAIITINRPPVNALNSEAYGELYECFYEISKMDEVKVVILTGHGKKAFVAGADIREFINLNSTTGPLYTRRNNSIREYIRQYNKPVICAINGLAYGGGCAIALVCDIKIACKQAMFNLAEISMGILGATQYIANLAHYGGACKLVYTGDPIDATEALRIGLIDEIVTKDKLMQRSIALAKRIASKPPLALRMAKRCMVKAQQAGLEEGLKYEENILTQLWESNDKNEAVKSFLEKKKPVFAGK